MTVVGSSYTLSSDWLTIASAVASSTAVVTTGLRLVGRVSTFKPTGWLIVSALVLSILGEMLKGLELDLSGIAASYIPTLTYNGQKYLIAQTRGDGACGAHALLGSKVGGMYQFVGDVRKHYVDTLNEKLTDLFFKARWEKMMIELLKDRLSPKRGVYSNFIFSDQDIAALKNDLDKLNLLINTAQAEQTELLIEASQYVVVFNILKDERKAEARRIKGLSEAALLEELERRDREFVRKKMLAIYEDIINVVDQVDPTLGTSLKMNRDVLDDLETRIEGLYQSYVEKESALSAYIHGVVNREYYFSTQELGFMAHLFNKHLTIFNRTEYGTIFIAEEEGDVSHEHVTIFHQLLGNDRDHFSRCEPMNLF
jgi:hypothetical protein